MPMRRPPGMMDAPAPPEGGEEGGGEEEEEEEEEEGEGEDGGWSGAAAVAAGEAMVGAGRGLCQANRGRDAAGNVVLCGKANGHRARCTGQQEQGLRVGQETDTNLLKAGAELCRKNRGGAPCKRPANHGGKCRAWIPTPAPGRQTDANLLKASAELCGKNRGGVPCKRPAKHSGLCTGTPTWGGGSQR
eukprot:COSAG01_NODE_9345_length_2476_cov_11.509045_1_plen_189_part_00